MSGPAASQAAPAAGKVDTVDCLVLKQRDLKVGKMTVFFAGDRIRVDSMNGQGTIISKAPDWTVLIFNRDRQAISVGPKDWHEKGLDNLMNTKRVLKWKPRATPFMGHKAWESTRMTFANAEDRTMEDFYRTKKEKPVKKSWKKEPTTYIASSKLGLTEAEYKFAQGLYQTPPSASVLLATLGPGPGKSSFSTVSIKKEKVPVSLFIPPRKLNRAPTITAVLTGKGIEEMLLNFSGAK
ncbi:MAG: hypothetical protein KC777_26080 [Cyanobacteria bacterium HKST-UBA02]|nr:hypothetical protein [Cyanobacteria bacterium HKST-UBA02]